MLITAYKPKVPHTSGTCWLKPTLSLLPTLGLYVKGHIPVISQRQVRIKHTEKTIHIDMHMPEKVGSFCKKNVNKIPHVDKL